MIAQAWPDADDYPDNFGFIQDAACGYVRDGNRVFISNILERFKQVLKQPPTATGINHLFVLFEVGRFQIQAVGFWLARVFIR
jgi:hypothetical protein